MAMRAKAKNISQAETQASKEERLLTAAEAAAAKAEKEAEAAARRAAEMARSAQQMDELLHEERVSRSGAMSTGATSGIVPLFDARQQQAEAAA